MLLVCVKEQGCAEDISRCTEGSKIFSLTNSIILCGSNVNLCGVEILCADNSSLRTVLATAALDN